LFWILSAVFRQRVLGRNRFRKYRAFTLVLLQDQRLFQLRWNGDVKEETELDCDEKTYLVFVNLYAADISAQGVSFGFDNNP
jgi:hypothetical protein